MKVEVEKDDKRNRISTWWILSVTFKKIDHEL